MPRSSAPRSGKPASATSRGAAKREPAPPGTAEPVTAKRDAAQASTAKPSPAKRNPAAPGAAKPTAAKAAAPAPSRPAKASELTGPLEALRSLCLSLPETTERLSHGEPTWFVRDKKTFVTYANHHHDDRLAFWCAAPPGAQEALVAADPTRYFRPPYVGHRGWLGVYLDVPDLDWAELAEIVEDAFRVVAPRTLVARLDGAG